MAAAVIPANKNRINLNLFRLIPLIFGVSPIQCGNGFLSSSSAKFQYL
jgi:hypothetical protein